LAADHLTAGELLHLLDGPGDTGELALRALAHQREVSTSPLDVSVLVEALRPSAAERRLARRAERAAAATARRRSEEAVARLKADRPRAVAELRELLKLTAVRRSERVAAAHRRFRSPVLAELLMAEARAALRLDPAQAVELLEVAAAVADRARQRRFAGKLVERLQVRVAGQRANALRVAGDRKAADALWRTLAAQLRRRPVGDPALEAELASLEASLRQDQRRFSEAQLLLTRAEALFEATGDREGMAVTLIQRAIVRRLAGEPQGAPALLQQAAALTDRDRSPRRFLEIQHNLALCLCQLGQHDEAAKVVATNRNLYARFRDAATRTLLAWLEGRIARAQGDHDGAERHLLFARSRYVEQRLVYDAALVSLDLADLFVDEGRTAEVKRLAQATAAVFASQEIQAEVRRALALFAKAALAERVTRELISRLRGWLEQAQRTPLVPVAPFA
jgi:tetratricopeptide (TPR) repeat protein